MTQSIDSAIDVKLFENLPKICEKIDEIQPTFKRVFQDLLEENMLIAFEKFGEENFIQNFQQKAQVIGKLTKEKFFEPELIRKFFEKSRKILESHTEETLNLHKNVSAWRSFIIIFLDISDRTIWCVGFQHGPNDEYFECLEFFYNVAEKNTQFNLRSSLVNILKKFDEQVEPAISIGNANPTFKNAIRMVLTRLESAMGSMKSWCLYVPIYVKNPQECAKYFVMNAILCSHEQIMQECAEFLYLFKEGKIAGDNLLEQLFKTEGAKLVPEVVKFIINLFREQHTERRGCDDVKITCRTMIFTKFLYDLCIMNYENFINCMNLVIESIGEEMNEINKNCFMDMIQNIREDEEFKAADEVPKTKHDKIYMAILSREKLQPVEVGEEPLTFQEIKIHKIDIQTQMITDSVLKVNDTNVYDKYLEFCQHIQKYRPKFKNELKQRIEEITAFHVYAPSYKNLKWEKITKFGLFIACLYQNDFIDFEIFEKYSELPRVNFLSCIVSNVSNLDTKEMIKYLKFYREIASRYPRMLKEDSIRQVDLFWGLRKENNQAMNSYLDELLDIFDNSLQLIKEKRELVMPSLRYFLDNVIGGCDNHKWLITLDEDDEDESAKFFLNHAILYPYSRLSVLVKNLKVLENSNEEESKLTFKNLMPSLVQQSRIIFNDEFSKEIENARRPIGITKFIAEFFLIGYLLKNSFDKYVKRMCDLVLKKPTECNIMCFLNLMAALENDENPNNEKVKRTKNFVDNKLKKKTLHFNDEMLDMIDCKNVIEDEPQQLQM
jgi:hypothetical protein